MNHKDKILQKLLERGAITSREVASLLQISRQGAAKHLRELLNMDKILKEGSTRKARYIPFSPTKAKHLIPKHLFRRFYRIRGLEEDRIFRQISDSLNLPRLSSEQAFKIIRYAFTEMLNNAIDHSFAPKVSVSFSCQKGWLTFKICDKGIGALESIRKKFHLKDPLEALEHLLKGKQTADPKRHSGQGIFFTSRAADLFILESSRLRLRIDNHIPDVFVEESRVSSGTTVFFRLKQKSRKALKSIFGNYSDKNYAFDKTEVKIKLSKTHGGYVSRSEAKRLLLGLESFKRIVLDFKDAPPIGQAFADEIFRIFQSAHPRIQIKSLNLSRLNEMMVRRARA